MPELVLKKQLLGTGLTVRETLFVEAYIRNGGNATHAIMDVVPKYQDPKKKDAAQTMGYEELSKPHVKQAIIARLEAIALNKGYVASKFHQLSNDPDSKEIQLRATKEIAHMIGAYADGGQHGNTGNNINIQFNMPQLSAQPRDNIITVEAKTDENPDDQ